MTDEQLQQMDTDELEVFLSHCAEESEKIGVDLDYYIMEFA
jgi:hypothetical protein